MGGMRERERERERERGRRVWNVHLGGGVIGVSFRSVSLDMRQWRVLTRKDGRRRDLPREFNCGYLRTQESNKNAVWWVTIHSM